MAEFNFSQPDAAPTVAPKYDFTMPTSDGDQPPTGAANETPVLTTINAFVNADDASAQANSLARTAESWNSQAVNFDRLSASAAASGDTAGAANYANQASAARSNAAEFTNQSSKAQTQAGAILFTLDANVNEVVEYESDVTQYAVEDGSPVSDNISIKSQGLSIDGVVTNMSMTKGNNNNVGRSKLQLAKSVLEGIYKARQVVTITSGLSVYADMAIKNIRIARSAGKGELTVALRLVQIRKVTLKTTASNFAPGKTSGKGGATKAKVTNQDDTPDATKEAKGSTILGALKKKLFN
jgi:hypothetical protein